MLDQNDPDTPTVPSPPKRKAILPVAPPSASSKSTAPLPSPMQRKHDKDHETKSRRFISDLTRVRLRRRIQKIYQMATDVIDGYGDEYYNNMISRFLRRLSTRSCSFIKIGLSAIALKWA